MQVHFTWESMILSVFLTYTVITDSTIPTVFMKLVRVHCNMVIAVPTVVMELVRVLFYYGYYCSYCSYGVGEI